MTPQRKWWPLLALALLLAGGGAWQWHRGRPAIAGAAPIAGGDGGGLPRAELAAEGFEPRALQGAVAWAVAQHAGALLVMRHGHLLVEQYSGGTAADTLVNGGEMADALVVLAAGIAATQNGMVIPPSERFDAGRVAGAIAAASGRSYPQFLSRNIWQPLNAATAQWAAPDVRARATDWLRVADLLLHDGRFEGSQVVPPGRVQRTRQSRAAPGAEPFADASMYYLRGSGATRLWLSPRFDLAVLCVAERTSAADETRLPNMIVRALRDRPGTGGESLDDLVPGH